MGRQISERGQIARKWLKRHQTDSFDIFEKDHPGLMTRSVFSQLRSKLNLPRVNKRKEAKPAPPKPVIKKTEAPVKTESIEDVPVPPPVGPLTDAGFILQATIKVWAVKGGPLMQLRTVTNSVIKEYKYIQQMTQRR